MFFLLFFGGLCFFVFFVFFCGLFYVLCFFFGRVYFYPRGSQVPSENAVLFGFRAIWIYLQPLGYSISQ